MFADRSAESAWAGERPRLRRGFGRVWNWVVGAVVIGLVVALVALVMNLGTMIQATRDHFAKRAPVGPSAVKASRSYTGHGAGLAFDKLNNTWWGPGISQAAEGEWLEVTFDQPTRLLDLVITPAPPPARTSCRSRPSRAVSTRRSPSPTARRSPVPSPWTRARAASAARSGSAR